MPVILISKSKCSMIMSKFQHLFLKFVESSSTLRWRDVGMITGLCVVGRLQGRVVSLPRSRHLLHCIVKQTHVTTGSAPSRGIECYRWYMLWLRQTATSKLLIIKSARLKIIPRNLCWLSSWLNVRFVHVNGKWCHVKIWISVDHQVSSI